MAKLFVNVTRRPVGWPESVQLPVSSKTVWNIPSSTTSPVTPLISTQSPRRMPFLPMSTNQPRKPTMKSFSATVRPAPARPRIVPSWLGGPKITSRIKSTAQICTETRGAFYSAGDFRAAEPARNDSGPRRGGSDGGAEGFHRGLPRLVRAHGQEWHPPRGLGGNQRRDRRSGRARDVPYRFARNRQLDRFGSPDGAAR